MSDQDVFNTDDQPVEQEPAANPFEVLVGEGKKYKTVEDAANAFIHAQNHIDTLEQENNSYREQLDELNKQVVGNKAVLDALEQRNTPNPDASTNAPLDEEALTRLVEQVVDKRSEKQIHADNEKAANEWVKSVYKENAKNKVAEVAANMGVSVSFLQSTARTSPAAFRRLMGEAASSQPEASGGSPRPSNVNTDLVTENSGVKNFAYYENIRKTKPKLYTSSQIQRELYENKRKLGSAFFNK